MTMHDSLDEREQQSPEETLGRWGAILSDGAFEEVFQALDEVVAHLERGRLPLEETVACYELGVRLAERCEWFLNEAELRVRRIDVLSERFEINADDDEPAF